MNITQFIVYKTDNPEEMTTLGTQDTGRKQTKNKQKKKKTENLNDEQHGPHLKLGVNPGDHKYRLYQC